MTRFRTLLRRIALALNRLRPPSETKYLIMQRLYYSALYDENIAKEYVGAYEFHEKYPYESYLLNSHDDERSRHLVALDYGCGLGRMILRMHTLFQRVDGIDISASMIKHAQRKLSHLTVRPNLYVTSGNNLKNIPPERYDFVYSTICLQHIASYSIRYNIFKEMNRILRQGGRIALQMVFSEKESRFSDPAHAHWLQDMFNAKGTNAECDCIIYSDQIELVRATLESAGFIDFRYQLAPLPHPVKFPYNKFIFLYGVKPKTSFTELATMPT